LQVVLTQDVAGGVQAVSCYLKPFCLADLHSCTY